MIDIARLGLFIFTYLVIFGLTCGVSRSHESFVIYIFLVCTFLLLGWIFYLHKIEKDPPRQLKEILYVISFLCFVTSIFGFLQTN